MRCDGPDWEEAQLRAARIRSWWEAGSQAGSSKSTPWAFGPGSCWRCLRGWAFTYGGGRGGALWGASVQTLRRAMLPYLRAVEPDLTGVPGHEVTDEFRTKERAEEMMGGLPGMRDALRLARSHGRNPWFSGAKIYLGASPRNTATLDIDVPQEHATCLGRADRATAVSEARELGRLIVRGIAEPHEGVVSIQVAGPHDVLHHLAYEFDAYWS